MTASAVRPVEILSVADVGVRVFTSIRNACPKVKHVQSAVNLIILLQHAGKY